MATGLTDKIIQMIPADGWCATWVDKDTSTAYCTRLAAWALIEEDYNDGKMQYVIGLIGGQDSLHLTEGCGHTIFYEYHSDRSTCNEGQIR